MRRDKLWINNAVGLSMIKNDLREMLKEQHTTARKELETEADYIYQKAYEKVPLDTGKLRDSIEVTVSRSPRYPGIIATAEAHNEKTGYDYARIQEEETSYKHAEGRQAHYLSEPFEEAVKNFFRRMGW